VKRIFFEESWARFFAGFGLKSFDDFFQYRGGQTIGKNNKRDVVTFKLGRDEQEKQFFMKRFFHPHFKDMLFARWNIGEFCSQARYEWESTKLLFDNEIRTYSPACYGEKMRWGLESKSFIVTEKLKGMSLTDFAQQNWQRLNRRQKEEIIVDLAVFIRRIHSKNLSLPDLYVWHIFLNENQSKGEPAARRVADTSRQATVPAAPERQRGEWEFAVIDLHRMSHNVTNKKDQLKNLGRLLHSMTERYFDNELKRLFIKSYAGNDWSGDINSLAAQVKKYSDKISARRKPKAY